MVDGVGPVAVAVLVVRSVCISAWSAVLVSIQGGVASDPQNTNR